ncbi:NAD(P)-dependent oxidoreductase [Plectonema radiosum NIES-515]|uniref:NAD(P)-dependent oxidoreductase n=1 Tax=Plectonema radiosum NIES-515 TaxID=2986073 RepID=A0ABT3B549_9CYAN|nr:NAD(P)-dependent oxidoreductase [Plectonema radiosum]MCV3216502.1 NAD(P)-dependent oxidoreductase [Plectonema radiosum NIES-515]
MKLLITGASGFLGKYVVAEALRKGHQVRAVVRPSSNEKRLTWHNHPNIELIRLDLRRKNGIVDAVRGMDAVIHLAAAKEGDFYTRFAGTVIATENLLDAMIAAGVLRLVDISTFSVYDYQGISSGTTITEDSLIESNPLERDEYAQTKLLQEQLVREFEQNHNALVTIVRPGLIYGRDNLWSSLLGGKLTDNLWLRIGGYATMPLTYVENCAEAIVSAICDEAIAQTLNIVDDNLPTQRSYVKKLKQHAYSLPRLIPVNWTLMRFLAWIMWTYNQLVLKGKARLPGIFIPRVLDARFKHFRFSNQSAKQILNWQPKYSLDTALERSCSNVELSEISYSTPEKATIEKLNV